MDILNTLLEIFTLYGYIAVFLILLVCGFGLPIPEDITLIASGVICALSKSTTHHLSVYIMIVTALLGVLLGDSIMFSLGRKLGPHVTRIPGIKRIVTPNIYYKIQEKVTKYGDWVLFVARFLPGLRAPIFVTTGISHKVPLWKFVIMDGMAAFISVPLWVLLGFLFADDLDIIVAWARKSEMLIAIVLSCILVTIFIVYRKKRST